MPRDGRQPSVQAGASGHRREQARKPAAVGTPKATKPAAIGVAEPAAAAEQVAEPIAGIVSGSPGSAVEELREGGEEGEIGDAGRFASWAALSPKKPELPPPPIPPGYVSGGVVPAGMGLGKPGEDAGGWPPSPLPPPLNSPGA